MNLDNLTVNVRPLQNYQAIDLGLSMARHWFMPLWSLWWRRMLPIMLLVGLGVAVYISPLMIQTMPEATGNPKTLVRILSWVSVLIWWLKPYAEIPCIIYLSQKLFDKDYTPDQAWQQMQELPAKYTLLLLTRYRLTVRRQILMPILILEQQNQSQTKARLRILSQAQNNAISWHTITFSLIETLLSIGILALVSQLFPTSLIDEETWLTLLQQMPAWLNLLMLLVYLLVISVLSPFYMASGFGIYICKRSLLEGWDIELKFRKLAQRFTDRATTRFDVAAKTLANATGREPRGHG